MITFLDLDPFFIQVETPISFPVSFDVEPFISNERFSDKNFIYYKIDFAEEFEPIWGKILYADAALNVMEADGQEIRVHIIPGKNIPYAITKCNSDQEMQVLIDRRAVPSLKWDRNLIGLFSLEHLCLKYQAFLLHAAFVVYDNYAIVFTAPSGTGKSTQAELWQKYMGAEIINGDRTLLVKREGVWWASGFPVCGSSEYCLKKSAPIKAIVCLSQNTDDSLKKLLLKEAFGEIYSQTFVNSWNASDVICASDYIQDVCAFVPVFHLSCTKEKSAVACLNNELLKIE